MRRLLSIITLGLALLSIGSLPLRGQSQDRVYEPFVATPDFTQAMQQIVTDNDYAGGVAKLGQLGAQNPGTTLGAVCLLQQAKYTDLDRVSIYQAVITGYPRSHFEIQAKLNLLDLQFWGAETANVQAFIQAADQLAQSYGGPALTDILRGGDQSKLRSQIMSLPVEFQDGLIDVYQDLHGAMANQLHEYAQVLPLDIFIRDAFAQMVSDQASRNLLFDAINARFGNYVGAQRVVDPTVRVLTPPANSSTGPRPKIHLELSTGGFTQEFHTAQVDLASLSVLLDGQDFRPYLTVSSTVDAHLPSDHNEEDETGQWNKPFEVIRLTGKPAKPLAKGSHTLAIVAPVIGYQGTGPGITRFNETFTVAQPNDNPENNQDNTSGNHGGQ